jgi:hypothetical protein
MRNPVTPAVKLMLARNTQSKAGRRCQRVTPLTRRVSANGSIDMPIKWMAGILVVLTLPLGIWAGVRKVVLLRQKVPPSNWAISNDRFSLSNEKGQFFLLSGSGGEPGRMPVPREWLIPPQEEKDEAESAVSSFHYDHQVTSFPIGNGKIGIHLSSYDIMPAGSMQGAAGRDVFLIYDPATGALSSGHVDLGITKERFRADGCFSAQMAHFLISDINQDGFADIGIVKEEIRCPEGEDSTEGPFYVQHAIHWYQYTSSGWVREAEDAGWPDRYTELPLIGMDISPVDFVGQVVWRSPDPSAWGNPHLYVPEYRKKLIASEAHKKSKIIDAK